MDLSVITAITVLSLSSLAFILSLIYVLRDVAGATMGGFWVLLLIFNTVTTTFNIGLLRNALNPQDTEPKGFVSERELIECGLGEYYLDANYERQFRLYFDVLEDELEEE